ncbi:hypothetical protein PFMALIP_05316 [Plasmodium falciparum MaliPS096_E11]|uniref:Uncharacterized protein n=1 Tax=Plasmodium falciparum MaliPS096_E11 TaxID=1036727 RepID=A0A024WJ06_PLAFA|nr:hypothetical protein PFMALIP_05316 [Plasmodium falciparum MaliPS096_E11]
MYKYNIKKLTYDYGMLKGFNIISYHISYNIILTNHIFLLLRYYIRYLLHNFFYFKKYKII